MATRDAEEPPEQKHPGPMNVVNGLTVPPFVSQAHVDSLKGIDLFPDDTWVVTYPKCGTTWTSQIVKSILSKKSDDTKILDQSVIWLEAANAGVEWFPFDVDLSSLERPRAFRSHMPYHIMPCSLPSGTPCKYIYIARNPKDAAVSLYHHFITFIATKDLKWDEFIPHYLSDQTFYGNYFDHVLSWWKHRHDENVLFMTYEDMKMDIRSSISRIASFMGLDLSKEKIEAVVDKSSLSYMKTNPTTNYERMSSNILVSSYICPYIRKGIVGGWQEWFSTEQSAQFDALYAQKCIPEGLELKFT